MSKSSEVLVLGAGGLLGSHLVRVLASDQSRSWNICESRDHFTHSGSLLAYLRRVDPLSIVNCIGYKGADSAEHYRINGCLPRVLADWCWGNGRLLIHVSTDAVFPSDPNRRWLPSDPIAPRTPYEISKAFGEDPRGYVIRATFLGESPKGTSLFDRMRRGEPFQDRAWNGVTVLALAQRISEILTSGSATGSCCLEHLHSSDTVMLSEVAGLLKSRSARLAEPGETRLLGGGVVLSSLAAQIQEYERFLDG